MDNREFRQLSSEAGIYLHFSRVESYNSIGVEERHHGPLLRVFRKVKEDHPRLDYHTTLRLAIKGCNDTLGPHGLIPTMLVFGSMSSLPIGNSKQSKKYERIKDLQTTRTEMEQYTVEQRIRRALGSKIPSASGDHITPGMLVCVLREDSKRWIGSVQFVKCEGKILHVTYGIKVKQFNVSHVMPLKTGHAATDEALRKIYKNSDDAEQQHTEKYEQKRDGERKQQLEEYETPSN